MLRKGSHFVSDILLKLIVVDVYMFTSVFFESLDVLTAQAADKSSNRHGEHSYPACSYVLGFKFAIRNDLLISKKLKSVEIFPFMVGIVYCTYLPFSRRQRPFIVFANVYMILFLYSAPENNVKKFDFLACFGYHLSIKIKFYKTVIIKGTSLFVFDV
jgi:hypothetical protein